MAFSSTVTKKNIAGNNRVAMGTFSQISGDTGGTVATGLRKIDNFQMTAATDISVSGGDVTVTTADPGAVQAGFWIAFGE